MPDLQESVLILNKYFLAIQVTDVKESICHLVTGKAKAVDLEYRTYNFKEWQEYTKIADEETAKLYSGLVRSPSITIFSPQVIIIPDCEFNNPKIRVVSYSRKSVYERDKFTCQYCRKKVNRSALTLDHVVPKSKGGLTTWTNIVTACVSCNNKKRDQLLSELGWRLDPPKAPTWRSHIGVPFQQNKKQFWERFLE